jgi:NDP-sugar pyrophosphorylase family protein
MSIQIVIPMSGFGERFRHAGYQVPKPLIEVEGKPMIGHVIDLFPGELEFIFICNQEHLANKTFRLAEILNELCPTGRIIGIPPHKLGPIFAIKHVEHLLDLNRPVVINYCDFACYWDWEHFKFYATYTECVGAIPAYKGFHPHSLGVTNYAYLKESDVEGGALVEDIQEKQPFTANRIDEYASSGTYYFASAKVMIDAFNETMDQNLNVGGEFYVSLAFKSLLKRGQKVVIYPLQHFMQWGTPEDLAEYNYWSKVFRSLLTNSTLSGVAQGSLVIPMAGMGQRFVDDGYVTPKPLITVSGKAMVMHAANDLPVSKYQSFVLRSDMGCVDDIKESIKYYFPKALVSQVPSVTKGQASTALIGLDALKKLCDLNGDKDISPVIFGACDNGVLFDQIAYQLLIDDPKIDVIVWGVRGYMNAVRNPHMFGWIDLQDNTCIKNISVKVPLAFPMKDPIVIGTFTFKKAADASRVINALIKRDGRINGEYYLDSCINDAIDQGLSCYFFEVDSFISWGTPNDLKTFEYWQSCFHKWVGHPYVLKNDLRVNANALELLDQKYSATIPVMPITQTE